MNINIYNPYVRQELELYHHGVAGQKWGKRNGPPYPLVPSAHSASEKKAGWRKSLNGGGESNNKKKRSKQVDRSISEEFGPYADLYKEYKKAEKRGETGISLEKELFALEDAMEFPEAFDEKAKKRYERLRELEDKGFINYVAKDHFTEHPFSAISPEYELKFLATAAEDPKLSEKSYAIDRYNAFQKKIIDNSIDWYFDEPKSEAAKKWKSEKRKLFKK